MTSTHLRPTRRSVVRGAAWTVPVISIAAAAPAFAASKKSSSGLTSTSTPEKWSNGNDKHVSWDLTLTNGDVTITSISIFFSYAPASGSPDFTQFEIYGYAPAVPAPAPGSRDNTWSNSAPLPAASSVTSTHGPIAANSSTRIHTDFGDAVSNAAGAVTAVANITYADLSTSGPITLGPVTWGSGNQHSHPV